MQSLVGIDDNLATIASNLGSIKSDIKAIRFPGY